MKTYIVGGIAMQYPIILGAGVCKDPRHLIPYLRKDTPLGALIAGSFTVPHRDGNQGVLQWPADWTDFLYEGIGLNSHGMPNPGIDESFERFATVPLAGYHALASLAPFTTEECVTLVRRANQELYLVGSEINWGCGNTGKIPDAYNYEDAHTTLRALEQLARNGELTKPLWIKLSPYLTLAERDELAEHYRKIDFSEVPVVTEGFAEAMVRLIAQYPFIKAIVFGNTLANCRVLDATGKPMTTPFNGKAGLSGPILKDISLRLIRRGIQVLPSWSELHFIASGGLLTGDDLTDALENGARAGQFTSGPAWSKDGRRFFPELITDSERLQKYLTQL